MGTMAVIRMGELLAFVSCLTLDEGERQVQVKQLSAQVMLSKTERLHGNI